MKLQNLIHILIGIVCIGLLPEAQAVVPAPDGGYPGFTTAEGQNALFSLTTGSANTAVGWASLFRNATGKFNTATGAGALLFNNGDATAGEANENTATGALALFTNTTGAANTANGAFALYSNTTGGGNTAIGRNALILNTTGFRNVALGSGAGSNVTTANDVICIGDTPGANVSNSCYIASIFNQTSTSGIPVLINGNSKLGTTTSSKRFKEEIKPMGKASEALFSLKPVTFRYKKEIDSAGTSQFGLVAEDVEKMNPDLVVRDKEGKPYSVRYDQVNAMLLNEFLKEHRRNEEQQTTIAQLKSIVQKQEAANVEQQKQIEALTAGLQRVSAQLEVSKFATGRIRRGGPAPQVVNNNQ